MKRPKDLLAEARINAGFKTREDAVAAFKRQGLNYFTLSSHENGNKPIGPKSARLYQKVFGLNPADLVFEDGHDKGEVSEKDVPLLSMVSAGNLRAQQGVEEHEIIRRIRVGDLPQGDWIALQVEGDSMNRVAPDGAIIVVNRADQRLVDGRYYVFSLGGGEATFKMFKRGPDRLTPYSTNPDHMAIAADMDDLYVFGRVKRVIVDV
jgi:phage repressor protein C with HTH and peptisase S24 domain